MKQDNHFYKSIGHKTTKGMVIRLTFTKKILMELLKKAIQTTITMLIIVIIMEEERLIQMKVKTELLIINIME